MSRWFKPTLLGASLLTAISLPAHSSSTPRIIDGTDASVNDWPFIVAMVSKGVNAYEGQHCGGSYIGGRYVLTAAHCVNNTDESDIEMVVGINNLNNESSEGERFAVNKIYVHPDYNDDTLENDIAIIELTRDASQFSSVRLADENTRANTADGTVLTVAGWGSTTPEYGNHTQPAQLQQVDAPMVNQGTCAATFAGVSSNVDSVNFCAGTAQEGFDSCRGDSGGPLVVKDTGIQLGIVSYGKSRCGEANSYGVYTNISQYTDWIEQHTSGFSYEQTKFIGFFSPGNHTHTFDFVNDSGAAMSFSNMTPSTGSITNNTCLSGLASGSSCAVTVRFPVAIYDSGTATLSFDYQINGKNYQTAAKANYVGSERGSALLADRMGVDAGNVYVNENPWVAYGDNGIRSATIGDSQQSAVFFDKLPRGLYAFDVGIDSEEGFDHLYLLVNGERKGQVSGKTSFSDQIFLSGGSNWIGLVYKKDGSQATSSDFASVSNFRHVDPTTQGSANTGGSSSGGGGSLGWLSLLALFPLMRRRK